MVQLEGSFFMKLTLEEKLRNAKLHVDEGVPLYEISKKYGIDVAHLKYDILLYKKWGEKPFLKEQIRKPYTREMKLKAIKEHLEEGKSLRQIVLELMLTQPGIVADWVRKYKKEGEAAIQDTYPREAYKHHDDKILEKEHKKLLEDLERTKAENEYLKKLYSLILKRSKRSKKK